MKIIYGPVHSRRLGLSLGISIVPMKTCNLDCIYCELGKTKKFTTIPQEFYDENIIFNELDLFIKNFNNKIDIFTITGYGEPTLNLNISKIANIIRNNYKNFPLALLTNSTLLDKEHVIESYKYFDIIIPSYDAVSQSVFEKVNKPAKGITSEQIFENLIILRKNFKKSLQLEILLCEGINDSNEEINLLYEKVKLIKPDKVWINTIFRSPAYKYAKKIDDNKFNYLMEKFNNFLI